MPTDTTVLNKHLKAVIDDLPAVLVFGSQTVNVTKDDVDEFDEPQIEGIAEERDTSIMVQASSLSPLPKKNDKVTLDGTQFRITRKLTSPDGVQITYDLRRLAG